MEKTALPKKLENDKLMLRKHTVDLAYAMFEEIDQDRERLRQFLPWVDHMKSVDNEIWYVNECIKDWNNGDMFDYGMFTSVGDYIGNIGVHSISWKDDRCELGYWITRKYEGQGYVTEAVRLLEKTLFEVGFQRIEIRCDPLNKKSAAVPLKNGYKFEGVLRKDKLEKGAYRDTAVYAKLREEFSRESRTK